MTWWQRGRAGKIRRGPYQTFPARNLPIRLLQPREARRNLPPFIVHCTLCAGQDTGTTGAPK